MPNLYAQQLGCIPCSGAACCATYRQGFTFWNGSFQDGRELPPESHRGAKFFGAFRARADAAQIVVAEDPGSVAVAKRDLDRIGPHGGGRFRACLGLEHG